MSTMKVTAAQTQGYVIGGVVTGFVVNVLSGTWQGHEWFWGSLGLVIVLAVYLIPSDGLLRRQRYGRARVVRILAALLLIAYPLAVGWLSGRTGLIALFVPASLLWLASSLLIWTSGTGEFGEVAIASAMMLVAVAVLLVGASNFRQWPVAGSVVTLLLGGALLTLGTAALRGGLVLIGAAHLLLTVVILVLGLGFLRSGLTMIGTATLLFAVAMFFIGANIVGKSPLPGVESVLAWGATTVMGLAILRQGEAMLGSACLLIAWAFLTLAIKGPRYQQAMNGAGILLFGGAFLMAGIAFLRYGLTLLGVAGLLVAVAALLTGTTIFLPTSAHRLGIGRFGSWLIARPSVSATKNDPTRDADAQERPNL